jgi:hypothetical protein
MTNYGFFPIHVTLLFLLQKKVINYIDHNEQLLFQNQQLFLTVSTHHLLHNTNICITSNNDAI